MLRSEHKTRSDSIGSLVGIGYTRGITSLLGAGAGTGACSADSVVAAVVEGAGGIEDRLAGNGGAGGDGSTDSVGVI